MTTGNGEHAFWKRVARQSATGVALVAAVFSLAVLALLAADYVQTRRVDPLNSPLITQRLQALAAQPGNQELQAEIRDMDLLARRAYFTSLSFSRWGAILLLGGVGVLLLALAVRHALSCPRPDPGPFREDDPAAQKAAQARRAVGALAVALVLVAAALAAVSRSPLDRAAAIPAPARPAVPAGEVKRTPSYPPWSAIRVNWPQFRGPCADGIAYVKTAPLNWDGARGSNVLWKTEIPLSGLNSPIVWSNRVFVAGATREAREVYCLDADTGALLWRRRVKRIPGSPAEAPEVSADTGYAAPTMATDGARAFAIFSTGDLIALDFDGDTVWVRNLGVPDNPYGHASSLVTADGLLLVQFDRADAAALMAFETATGKTAWETKRQVEASWASPLLVHTADKTAAILNATPFVASYDARTGQELWRVECMSGEVGPSLACAGDSVFAVNGFAKLVAVNMEDRHIAWESEEDLPDVSSPVATGPRLLTATSGGAVVCRDAKTGTVVWTHTYDEGFYASPILAADRVYLMDKAGVMHVLDDGPEYQELAVPALGEPSDCTPAFVEGRLYIRGQKHLYCIGETR